MWCMELSSHCFAAINIHRLEAGVSENLCSFLKEVKPLLLYSVTHGIAMEPMKGKWPSSRGTPSYFAFLKCISVHLVL